MWSTLKFLLALTVALLLMLAFRAMVFTIYTVEGNGLAPAFVAGDRVVVNRWSYGLRTGDDRLFRYGRTGRRPVTRGDIVAFEDPRNPDERVLICRCKALPGDTVRLKGRMLVVPGLATCADFDYYYMEALGKNNPEDSRTFGLVPEQAIIGRASRLPFKLPFPL